MSDQSHIPFSLRDPERYGLAYSRVVAVQHILDTIPNKPFPSLPVYSRDELRQFWSASPRPESFTPAELSEVWDDFLAVRAMHTRRAA